MKRLVLAALMTFTFLIQAGCGNDGGSAQPLFVAHILSDSASDGDIARDAVSGVFTVTQGMSSSVQSVFAGIDPTTGAEYRTFLDFPLTGAGGVPGSAVIASAFLDIVITSILPQPLSGTIPIRIDLVSFQPPTLVGADFDRTLQPALATTTIIPPISQSDFGGHVTVDVTALMVEAQRLGLLNFQVRILRDLGTAAPGLIEINDTTGANRSTLAPLLQVSYF
ncbi:hypothetical protein FO488_08650 [Geobacter sp. FeAm09]|uniref:hypothetical protein n=1 Tax=Geobacter sp. FeAm09 TaxID=2597769 RepID=UPI0011EE2822|nr:hypothetical protein [Geobacter sp. FeAm09]QEM68225.1 hypothetical protein FO488_08650 [Geobacter sp. FeAm09]